MHVLVRDEELVTFDGLPCDLYLKSNTRFFKRYSAGDETNIQEIRKELGADLNLYVTEEDYTKYFSTSVSPSAIDDQPIEEIHVVSDQKFGELMSSLRENKNSWDSTKVDESVKWLKDISSANSKLLEHLKKLNTKELSYSYKKIQILYFLFLNTISALDKFSTDTVKLLTYMAFFCDIGLEDDKECRILTMEDLELTGLDEVATERVMNHALVAQETIKGIDKLPHGLSTFCLQHHGMASGVGFPEKLSFNIAPLSQVYIVYENFAWYLMENFGQLNPTFLLRHLRETFNKGVYLQSVQALEHSMKDLIV